MSERRPSQMNVDPREPELTLPWAFRSCYQSVAKRKRAFYSWNLLWKLSPGITIDRHRFTLGTYDRTAECVDGVQLKGVYDERDEVLRWFPDNDDVNSNSG